MQMFNGLLWLLCGWSFQPSHGEIYACDDFFPCAGETIECTAQDEICTVTCFGTGVCANTLIKINEQSESTAIFNVSCNGQNACTNMTLRADRQGKLTCHNPDFTSDWSLETCHGIDVTIIDNFGAPGTSELQCKGFVCANFRLYTYDPTRAILRCRGIDGCSRGTIDWYCNGGGGCRLRGNTNAFRNSSRAFMYCDPSEQGDECQDPMPQTGITRGWTFVSTNFPSSAPTQSPTQSPTLTIDITAAPSMLPSSAPTSAPSAAPTPDTESPTEFCVCFAIVCFVY